MAWKAGEFVRGILVGGRSADALLTRAVQIEKGKMMGVDEVLEPQ